MPQDLIPEKMMFLLVRLVGITVPLLKIGLIISHPFGKVKGFQKISVKANRALSQEVR